MRQYDVVRITDVGKTRTTARSMYERGRNEYSLPFDEGHDAYKYDGDYGNISSTINDGQTLLVNIPRTKFSIVIDRDGVERIQLQEGQEVVCINDKDADGNIEYGKIYTVRSVLTSADMDKITLEGVRSSYTPHARRFVPFDKNVKEWMGEEKQMEETKLQERNIPVGAYVKGLGREYSVTGEDMILGIVRDIRDPRERENIKVEVLIHKERSRDNDTWWVKSESLEIVGEDYVRDITIENLKVADTRAISELEDLRENIEYAMGKINEYWKAIARRKNEVREKQAKEKMLMKLIENSNAEEEAKELYDMITSIPQIKSFISRKTWIEFETDYIDFYDGAGNKYQGNKYRVELNTRTSDVRFYPLDDTRLYLSYWDREDALSPHPHIGVRPTQHCLGNAGDLLCECSGKGDIFGMVMTVISFLQQCNEGDVAGAYCKNWKQINEDGEVLEPEGVNNTCCVCGEIIEDEDDMETCEDCGGYMHTHCSERVYGTDGRVCNDCLGNEDEYRRCSNCNYWHSTNILSECDECGNDVCEECRIQRGGHVFCHEDCADEMVTWCDECDEYVSNENFVECPDCGCKVHEGCGYEGYHGEYCSEEHRANQEVYCESCDQWKPKEGSATCERCSEVVCEDCKVEYSDNDFCCELCKDNWREENETKCAVCGEFVPNDEIQECDQCDDNVCDSCVIRDGGDNFCCTGCEDAYYEDESEDEE